MPDATTTVPEELKKRYFELPEALRDAIASSDLEKKLQAIASRHELHLDRWELLENEVMLVLLGIQPAEALQENIVKEAGLPEDVASQLASDIALEIFEPIRQSLEENIDAAEEAGAAPSAPPAAPAPEPAATISPATPPPPPPETKAVRAPLSGGYAARAASHERQSPEGDPYREQII